MKIKHIFAIIIISLMLILISCYQESDPPEPISEEVTEITLPEKEAAQPEIEPELNIIDEKEEEHFSDEILFDLSRLGELENSFNVRDAFPDASFERPLDLQNAGDSSGRVFVVEQGGRIFVLSGHNSSQPELFLDISNRIVSGGEKGLLGLAFHPQFQHNGFFYINYTDEDSTIISRFNVYGHDPNKADPDSEQIILTFLQPYANHNGGQIAFGPHDGYLYIATGDGGGAGDPQGNSQNLNNLLGKILRIDIDNKEPGLNYSIPSQNPFKENSNGYREEIYAYGLRNPWRFSFDHFNYSLWAADVGQDRIEEINIIEKGKNYGWNIMEGSLCFNPPTGCDTRGLELPIYEYEHPLGRSITGGYVYYGNRIPELYGIYVYADFITGYIWGLAYDSEIETQNFTLASTDLNISSFGVDEELELYLTAFDGNIYELALP